MLAELDVRLSVRLAELPVRLTVGLTGWLADLPSPKGLLSDDEPEDEAEDEYEVESVSDTGDEFS